MLESQTTNERTQARLLQVRIDGNLYSGWEAVSIRRSLDALSGDFEVQLTDQSGQFPFTPGTSVAVVLPGRLPIWDQNALRGKIDRVRASLAGDSHQIAIAGRDHTADLVDCSIDPDAPAELYDVSLADIVRQLSSPFGVGVDVEYSQATVDNFPKFSHLPGESAFAAIDRATRLRGILAYSNGNGRVRLERPSGLRAESEIVEGVNLLSGSWEWNDSGRFKTYVVRGQRQGTDAESGLLVAAPEGRAEDESIGRFRPLVVLAEGPVTSASARERAAWEATVRASRAVVFRAVVASWKEGLEESSPIWRVNRLVRIRVPSLGLDRDMLLNRVVLSLNESTGETAQLSFVRPSAYTPKPALDAAEDPMEEVIEGTQELEWQSGIPSVQRP